MAADHDDDIFAGAAIKPDGDVWTWDDGHQGVMRIDNGRQPYWFTIDLAFAENGNDFWVVVRYFGFTFRDAGGGDRGRGRAVFTAKQAASARKRISEYYYGPEDKIIFPFHHANCQFLGVIYVEGWALVEGWTFVRNRRRFPGEPIRHGFNLRGGWRWGVARIKLKEAEPGRALEAQMQMPADSGDDIFAGAAIKLDGIVWDKENPPQGVMRIDNGRRPYWFTINRAWAENGKDFWIVVRYFGFTSKDDGGDIRGGGRAVFTPKQAASARKRIGEYYHGYYHGPEDKIIAPFNSPNCRVLGVICDKGWALIQYSWLRT